MGARGEGEPGVSRRFWSAQVASRLPAALRDGGLGAAFLVFSVYVHSDVLRQGEKGSWASGQSGYVLVGLVLTPVLAWYLYRVACRVSARLAVVAAGLLGGLVAGRLGQQWWDRYQDAGYSQDGLLYVIGLDLALTLGVAGVLLAVEQGEGPVPVPREGAAAGSPLARPWLRLGAGAARVLVSGLAVVVVLGGGLVAVRAVADPAVSVTVEPAGEVPAVPGLLDGEVTWTQGLKGAELTALYRGARGAVLVTGRSALGVSVQDGSTTWRYTWPWRTTRMGSATSPDGTHLALTFDGDVSEADSEQRRVVVLDTATGEVVVQRVLPRSARLVQLTNSSALLGLEVVSLKDGSAVRSLEGDAAQAAMTDDAVDHPPLSGGRSTFVLGSRCSSPGDGGQGGSEWERLAEVCSLELLPDTGESPRSLDGVVEGGGLALVDGWTVRQAGGSGDSRKGREPGGDGRALEAVSIDDGSTWPLGDGDYVAADPVASVSRLVLYNDEEHVAGGRRTRGELVASLDVATGELTLVASPVPVWETDEPQGQESGLGDGWDHLATEGWPTADTSVLRLRNPSAAGPDGPDPDGSDDADGSADRVRGAGTVLELGRCDGSDGITVPLADGVRGHLDGDYEEYGGYEGYRELASAVVAVPGGVVLAHKVRSTRQDGSGRYGTGIYLVGLR